MLLRQITTVRPITADRTVYVGKAATFAEAGLPTNWPSGHAVVAVLADAREWPGAAIVEWAQALIEAGAAYVCCWGPDCGRVESCFDEAFVDRELTAGRDLPVLMTTSHEKEPLLEAIWFAAITAHPLDEYADDCNSLIVLTIGDEEWAGQATAYLEAGAPLLDEA